MTPDTIFLARVAIEHFKEAGDDQRSEETAPMLTALAFRLEAAWIALSTEQANESADRDTAKQAYIISELLNIAMLLDFSDEAGRRKLFTFMRSSLVTNQR